MQRADIQNQNPEHYAAVKADQERMRKICSGKMRITRICPYCEHKIDEIVQGMHGYTFAKCDKCGEMIIFPPMSFRKKA